MARLVAFSFVAVGALLTACATEGSSENVSPPPEASGSGCIDSEVHACANIINQYLKVTAVSGMSVDEQLARQSTLDVNGKPVAGRTNRLAVLGTLKIAPFFAKSNGVTMVYNESRIVEQVTVSLGQNPLLAHTPAEYATTGVWEAALIAGGSRCAPVGSLAMYQFVENQLKPAIKYGEKEYDITDANAETTTTSYTPPVPVCGDLKVSYGSSYGVDTSTITIDNPKGLYAFSWLTFTH
jgi:hypothetical protein